MRKIFYSIFISYFIFIYFHSSLFSQNVRKHNKTNDTIDMAIISIVKPESGNNLSLNENVIIKVYNKSNIPITNIPVSYSIDSEKAINDTVKYPINPKQVQNFTFKIKANLGNYRDYTLKCWLSLNNDTVHTNDTLTRLITNKFVKYCDSYAKFIYYENIGKVVIGSFVHGNDSLIYNNKDAIHTYTDNTINVPAIKLIPDSTYNIEISQIHYTNKFHSTYINVYIDYNQDGVFDYYSERFFGKATTLDETKIKGKIKIPADAKSGYTRMRIVMVEDGDASTALPCNPYSWGETEDYKLLISPNISNDAGIINILSPANKVAEDETIPVTVVLKNFGNVNLTNVDILFRVNNSYPIIYPWTGSISPQKTENITIGSFKAGVFNNIINAYTILENDTNFFNDQFAKSFYGVPKLDAGCSQLLKPIYGECHTSEEILKIRVKNYGSQVIDLSKTQLVINIGINGPLSASLYDTTNTGIIQVGDSIDIEIKNKINMSNSGTYIFTANTIINGDEDTSNDKMKQQNINVYKTISNFPYTQNFETLSTGETDLLEDGWIIESDSYYKWYVENGKQNKYTGPIFDHTKGNSQGKYLMIRADSTGNQSYLYSPCINLTNLNSKVFLSFWYFMYGLNINSLDIDIYDGSNWINRVFTIKGQQQVNQESKWEEAIIDLTEYKNTIKIRFTSSSGNGKFGNISIDDISIYLPHQNDACLYAITSPLPNFGETNTYQTIKISVRNYGLQTINNMGVGIIIDNTDTIKEQWHGDLITNQTQTYTFTKQIQFAKGEHLLQSFISLLNDENNKNDTIGISYFAVESINPYFENFEKFSDTTNQLMYKSGWTTNNDTDFKWYIKSGPSGQLSSGPAVDHSQGNYSGKYFLADALNGYDSNEAYLISPPIDLAAFIKPRLSFWYHSFGRDINSLNIDIFYNNIWKENIASIKGEKQTYQKAAWENIIVDLSSYKGVIKLRFNAIRGITEKSDIAIDDVSIENSFKTDGSLIAISQPDISSYTAGSTQQIKIRIYNNGSETIKSIYPGYIIGNNSPLIEKCSSAIYPGKSIDYTFTKNFKIPTGNFKITTFIELYKDENSRNDTLTKQYMGIAIKKVPYFDDFENQVFWFNNDDGIYHWEEGKPNKSFIDTSYSPENIWATNLNGNYYGNATYCLYTPKFDFSNATNPVLSFWHWINLNDNNDGCYISYLIDGSVNTDWITLGYIGDPNGINWYNTYNVQGYHCWNYKKKVWMLSSYNLNQFSRLNSPIRFRFVFFSTAKSQGSVNGWAIDNFSISVPGINKDAGIDKIIAPNSYTKTDSTVSIIVRIKNFGTDTLTSVPLYYQIDTLPSINETYTGRIFPGDTVNYTFKKTFKSKYKYNLIVSTRLTSDLYTYNDSKSIYISNDVGIFWISEPLSQTVIDTNSKITVLLKNFGISNITQTDITYKINGFPQQKETWIGKLLPGEITPYTFTTALKIKSGNNLLCAYTSMKDDAKPENNQICKDVNVLYSVGIKNIVTDNFKVKQTYPNPTKDKIFISYQIPINGNVTLKLYNILGVEILKQNYESIAGENFITLQLLSFSEGMYYYQIEFQGEEIIKNIIKIR